MLFTYVILGAILLLAAAWAVRRAWQDFVLEMEGYEFSEDVEHIHASRRRAKARREALARMVEPAIRQTCELVRKARSAACSLFL